MTNLKHYESRELLSLYSRVLEELRERGIIRTSNNPVGDLAEYLFCKAFGWKQSNNSNPNIDALDKDGVRYQIKARRITKHNRSRQLSAIRDLDKAQFDFIAAILFSEDYSIMRAALIPYNIALKQSKFVSRTNSHKLMLRDNIWNLENVRDVTEELKKVIL